MKINFTIADNGVIRSANGTFLGIWIDNTLHIAGLTVEYSNVPDAEIAADLMADYLSRNKSVAA